MSDFRYSVSDLLNTDSKLAELVHELDLVLADLDPILQTQSNLKATLTLRRVGDSIGALLTGGEVNLELPCIRCLNPCSQVVGLEPNERYFHPCDQVPTAEEGEEFLLSEDGKSIDIQELLRQELILALPAQPLCKEDCPGNAQYQAKAKPEKHRPLAELTDLWQSQQEE